MSADPISGFYPVPKLELVGNIKEDGEVTIMCTNPITPNEFWIPVKLDCESYKILARKHDFNVHQPLDTSKLGSATLTTYVTKYTKLLGGGVDRLLNRIIRDKKQDLQRELTDTSSDDEYENTYDNIADYFKHEGSLAEWNEGFNESLDNFDIYKVIHVQSKPCYYFHQELFEVLTWLLEKICDELLRLLEDRK